ncbi:MAG: RseC/MucC family positive regulator of sigma(E), partial [Bacteroidetes bacterium HGW-Bacteroidetes-22]
MQENVIKHAGTIRYIDAEKLIVVIHTVSACSSCHEKGGCGLSEQKDKEVELKPVPGRSYAVGDLVEVKISRTAGLRAVLWAYLAPFAVLMTILLVVWNITGNQELAGLLALVGLAPYFFILYLLRDR